EHGARGLSRGSPHHSANVHPAAILDNAHEPRPDRTIVGGRMLEGGNRGVLQEVVGIGIAMNQGTRKRAHPLELTSHRFDVHTERMPRTMKLLERTEARERIAGLRVQIQRFAVADLGYYGASDVLPRIFDRSGADRV